MFIVDHFELRIKAVVFEYQHPYLYPGAISFLNNSIWNCASINTKVANDVFTKEISGILVERKSRKNA